MDVVVWLRSLGLRKYEAVFRENEITEKVLPNPQPAELVQIRRTFSISTRASTAAEAIYCATARGRTAQTSRSDDEL
jgi:hypothetical protein